MSIADFDANEPRYLASRCAKSSFTISARDVTIIIIYLGLALDPALDLALDLALAPEPVKATDRTLERFLAHVPQGSCDLKRISQKNKRRNLLTYCLQFPTRIGAFGWAALRRCQAFCKGMKHCRRLSFLRCLTPLTLSLMTTTKKCSLLHLQCCQKLCEQRWRQLCSQLALLSCNILVRRFILIKWCLLYFLLLRRICPLARKWKSCPTISLAGFKAGFRTEAAFSLLLVAKLFFKQTFSFGLICTLFLLLKQMLFLMAKHRAKQWCCVISKVDLFILMILSCISRKHLIWQRWWAWFAKITKWLLRARKIWWSTLCHNALNYIELAKGLNLLITFSTKTKKCAPKLRDSRGSAISIMRKIRHFVGPEVWLP